MRPFQKVGCDIWCNTTTSVQGHNYMPGFTCYGTSFAYLLFMKTKDEAPIHLERYLQLITSRGLSVERMRMDSNTMFK